MDYCSSESEVIDSFNHLPVKRGPWNTHEDYSVYCKHSKNIFRHKLTTKRSNSYKHTSHEESSTSLILKKTSESQFLKLYPVASHASFHCQKQSSVQYTERHLVKNRPLIQVTVIPKSKQNLRAKLFKQRINTTTLQTTSSNHENSIQTKNVYLVVAGRNKEKIYEIKTTGSAKFEKESPKDDAVKNQRNIKHFIKNFNMERKRKKDIKKKDVKNDERIVMDNTSVRKTKKPLTHNCTCSPKEDVDDHKEVHDNDLRSGRSRVRIFGRVGITEDDKYYLKCQATVDDKPVPTLPTAEKQPSSSSLAHYSNDLTTYQRYGGVACLRRNNQDTKRDIKGLRDSIMQTDYQNDAVQELLTNIDKKNRISNESQSTQVNFNKITSKALVKTIQTSESTRCICSNNDCPLSVNGFDGKNLKSCQSPVVIISVFPKQDNNVADLVKTVQCAQIESKRSTYYEKPSGENKTNNENTTKKPSRSRSPSPKSRKMKSKLSKTIEPRQVKTNTRIESPTRLKLANKDTKKDTNSPKQTLQLFNSNTKIETEDKKRKPSIPKRPRGKSPPASSNKKEPQNMNISRQNLNPKPKSKSPKRKVQDVGINTEHLKTKKELVDSYTNKINKHMKLYREKDKPVENLSKISVNIESENEYYDVSFLQNQFTTDLNIRKTIKEASTQEYFDVNQNLDSMANVFPYMSKKHRKKSICENPSDGLINIASRLILRDSLEIGHRREEDKVTKVMQTRRIGSSEGITVNSDMEFLAPIKHFTGDNCTICDPVKRDQEIRELLGVEGRRAKSKSQFKDPQSQVSSNGDQMSRHCFYSYQRENTFVAGFALNPNGRSGERINFNNPNTQQSDDKMQYEDNDKTNSNETNSNNSINNHFHPYQDEAEDPCPCDGKDKTCNLPCCKKTNYGTQYENNVEKRLPMLVPLHMPVPIQKYSDSDSNKHFEQFNQNKGETGVVRNDRLNMYEDSSDRIDDGRNYNSSSTDKSDIIQYKDDKGKLSSSQENTDSDPNIQFDQTDLKELNPKTSVKQQDRQRTGSNQSDTIPSDETPSDNTPQYNDNDKTKRLSSQKNNEDDPNISLDQTDQKEENRKTCVKQKYLQSMEVDPNDRISKLRNYKDPNRTDKIIQYKFSKPKRFYNRKSDDDPNKYFYQSNQKDENRKTSVKQKDRKSIFIESSDRIDEDKNYNDPNQPDNISQSQYNDNDKTKCLSNQKNDDDDPEKYVEPTNQKDVKRKSSGKKKNLKNTARDICPCENSNNKFEGLCEKLKEDTKKEVEQTKQEEMKRKTDTGNSQANQNQPKSAEGPNLDRTALYQQLTLNRNIQIFLQVEQFAKNKPIVLSKKQYKKIKKTIENTILSKDKSKNVCLCNVSIVSVKEMDGNISQDVNSIRKPQTGKDLKRIKANESKKHSKSKKRSSKQKENEQVDTVMLFSNDAQRSVKEEKLPKTIMKRAASSMEIRNASIAYWQHITFSSTNVGSIGSSSYAHRNQKSIETIFRGHKKSLTPNLGTSAFSLISGAHVSEPQSMKLCSPGLKARKPFLRRLMSCLVMRSPTGSEKKAPVNLQSVNSSVDSYHFSTSLGAIEMTSSIYDTSASFYSNHSIHPLSNKLKKSFFSSVRGFLTNRKS